MDGEGSSNEELLCKEREVAELRARLAALDRQLAQLKAEKASQGEGDSLLMECEQAYSDLVAFDQLKSNFLSVISHELRTPLTALLGYTDLVLKGVGGPLTSKQEHYLRASLASGKELMSLINTLIEFSILDAGKGGSRPSEVNVVELVDRIVAQLRQVAASKRVTIEKHLPPVLPAAKADESMLSRSFEALLANAIKFTPSEGKIGLEAHATTDHIVISVTDSGIGMPVEELDRIWERFYQVDSSPTRRFGGLGLGLALAKKLIEMQNGRIWAESDGPEQGATFKIELPLWEG